jgi:hypothetical protein
MKIETIKMYELGNVKVAYMSKSYLTKIHRAFLEKDPKNDVDRSEMSYKMFYSINPDNEFYYRFGDNKVNSLVGTIIEALKELIVEIENFNNKYNEKCPIGYFKWYNTGSLETLLDFMKDLDRYGFDKWHYPSETKIIAADHVIIELTYDLRKEPVPIQLYGYFDIIFRSLLKIIKETKNLKL